MRPEHSPVPACCCRYGTVPTNPLCRTRMRGHIAMGTRKSLWRGRQRQAGPADVFGAAWKWGQKYVGWVSQATENFFQHILVFWYILSSLMAEADADYEEFLQAFERKIQSLGLHFPTRSVNRLYSVCSGPTQIYRYLRKYHQTSVSVSGIKSCFVKRTIIALKYCYTGSTPKLQAFIVACFCTLVFKISRHGHVN